MECYSMADFILSFFIGYRAIAVNIHQYRDCVAAIDLSSFAIYAMHTTGLCSLQGLHIQAFRYIGRNKFQQNFRAAKILRIPQQII